jgi:superfamily II DNA or RNA helicase
MSMAAVSYLPGLFEPVAAPALRLSAAGDDPTPDHRGRIQAEMVESVVRLIDAGTTSAVIEAATGTGKSKTAADLGCRLRDERGWRLLFVVDETDLALQLESELSHWGLHPTVEMSDRRAEPIASGVRADCVIASRQTLGRKGSGRERYEALLNRLRWPRADLLVIDEAHCGVKGDQIKAIREAVGPRFCLGLSATPYLASGERLVPTHFGSTAYCWPAEDFPDGRPGAISSGHLVPPWSWDCKTSVDLRGLKTQMTEHGRDYRSADLTRVVGEAVGELTNAARMDLQEHGPFRRALCFTPSVELAKTFAGAFSQIGLPAAACYGDHPDKLGVLRRYREGAYRILCVCQMGTKGFDDPPTDALILARPTKSYPLARQMLGRGLRLSPQTGKERCLVLGFAWQSAPQSAPVSVLDIFIEGLPDPDARAAAARLRAGRKGPVDVNRLVKEARAEAERAREERAARVRLAVTRRDVRHGVRRRDVMASRRGARPGLPTLDRGPRPAGRATAEQAARLRACGFGDRAIRGYSESYAAGLLRTWEGRREAGMASYPMANYLRSLDPSVSVDRILEMTASEAGALIDRLKRGRDAGLLKA